MDPATSQETSKPVIRRRSSVISEEICRLLDLSGAAARDLPIRKLLVANRGEIAIRIIRAAKELGIETVAIYSAEDRKSLHRYKADEAYLVGEGKNPVRAYLDQLSIIAVARAAHADAIHPGYGFLAENADFAALCEENGFIFVGPHFESIRVFGDKTAARTIAQKAGVSIVPGTDGPVATAAECRAFAERFGLPVMLKAAFGGGGRGMRVVRRIEDVEEQFTRASSEALAAFGDGSMFVERFVEHAKHIEVQILGDGVNVIHLFERDCSVQRRHQKVVECAPAPVLDPRVRQAVLDDAVRLMTAVNYCNAGTVEFLVEPATGQHYFIEVNPRIQVEHTVTEEVTGVDLVQTQLLIAGGRRLPELGLDQAAIVCRGFAVQCRITTEDPERNFQPDTGRIEAYRPSGGMGVRLDGASMYAGAAITPFYDSLLVKVTVRALTFEGCLRKMLRTLTEMRIRGVKTNVWFLKKVLSHPAFASGLATTGFIDQNPELVLFNQIQDRGQKLLRYLGEIVVNGPQVVGATAGVHCGPDPLILPLPTPTNTTGWRQILLERGPEAFARSVRARKGLMLTDTTWRDAHQSLLATRMRTIDIAAIAPWTGHLFGELFSLEMWGGATFDVCLRFLHEDPWERLDRLRALVPHIPFQMLLRGANGVGYTSYPDNVIFEFCKKAKDHGIDIFRVFDALNYLPNLKLGIDAVHAAGGVVEASICYSGDVSDPTRTKYTLKYYIDIARELIAHGIHILGIKDMSGLLKPQAARLLIAALRAEFPAVPIHVHTHDTAGCGVASMLEAARAGADVVDVAVDAMSGMTSQPSMGAIVAATHRTDLDTKIRQEDLALINDYWEQIRDLYMPFDSGQKSGSSEVYLHEMPGGQMTNLQFQSRCLGLNGQWRQIKDAYIVANRLLGDLVKVTPTSKVVGDMAQFMVQNGLTESDVIEKATTLSFPESVVEFMQGLLGQPVGGFPEPLRTHILKGRTPINGRPGETMAPLDFTKLRDSLVKRWGAHRIKDTDVLSAALYPKVFEAFMEGRDRYGDLSIIPTRLFCDAMVVGSEAEIPVTEGKVWIVKLLAVGHADECGSRDVFFDLNGQTRTLAVSDKNAEKVKTEHEKADPKNDGSVGAPMSGQVVDVRVAVGKVVKIGDPLCVMTAMKMEIVVSAAIGGKIDRIAVKVGDDVAAGDLIALVVP